MLVSAQFFSSVAPNAASCESVLVVCTSLQYRIAVIGCFDSASHQYQYELHFAANDGRLCCARVQYPQCMSSWCASTAEMLG
jgi:hypothetical protein